MRSWRLCGTKFGLGKLTTMKARIVLLAAFLALAFLLSACDFDFDQTGYLEGKMTYRSLTPGNNSDAGSIPQANAGPLYRMTIYMPDGKTVVGKADVQADGSYRTGLRTGHYVVDVNRVGSDRVIGLPAKVTIRYKQITRLDFLVEAAGR